ncbi:unnamed protein product [Oikopleura dioica]|uniref:Uncharacterized protein n=1 Tax=Oikopleura dioica TaxID=34765 RepID=E4XTJ4_OIKDI|nr:unnamed protein product [Oikopleura dioica]
MNDSHDETVSAAVADRMKTLKVEEQNDNNKEIKEKQSKIIDYPRLFLLRMRDHHLSQTPPLDLPSIQGVTFVQTCDNNNSESMRGDLIFDPDIYEEAGHGEIIQHGSLNNGRKDEWDE